MTEEEEIENAFYYYRPISNKEREKTKAIVIEKLKERKQLEKENEELQKENAELKAQIEKINELNVHLQNRFLRLMKFKIENEELQKENKNLKIQLKVAEERIDTLSSTNIALSNQIAGLQNNLEGQKARKNHHIKENAILNGEVGKLKAQIKPLEDRICSLRRKNASLENKVEKMKCCGNCKKRNSCIKHNNFVYPEMTNPINYNCYDLDKWECRE